MARAVIRRVRLKNFKSIASCDLSLRRLSFLVGPNGSGKSNFLDALRLTRDALISSLDFALRDRGGLSEVRRKSGGHPTHFEIELHFDIGSSTGLYRFRVGALSHGAFDVQREECKVSDANGSSYFVVESGVVKRSSIDAPPKALKDRLYLVTCSGLPAFRPVFDALSNMGFYNLNPKVIRDLQSPQDSRLLKLEGENIASVLGALQANHPDALNRIEKYLRQVVPTVHGVRKKEVGPKETLEFFQDVGLKNPWRFFAQNMSDGTLRALGVLTALFQVQANPEIPLIGIEEPEAALHPGAAKYLREALREASESAQVIVTSHSPELLDDLDIEESQINVVSLINDHTFIARADAASREAMRTRLCSAGELLRMNQLEPDTTFGGTLASEED